MAKVVCLSPLRFYDNLNKQNHRKNYAYGHISPLIVKPHKLSPFQFVIPEKYSGYTLYEAYLHDAKSDNIVLDNMGVRLLETGFRIDEYEGYKIAIYNGLLPIQDINQEGVYYLEIVFKKNEDICKFFSEVFCFTNSLEEYIELEYWNESGNFHIKDGIIVFPKDFKFKLLLKSEIGKPEYNFEEESTKRLGYTFIESQVSKKIYKFNSVLPEFICDALRIVRLCDNKIIRAGDDKFEAITFEMDVDWQTQGDLASVTCEFETDNVIVNLGGFVPEHIPKGGDFNSDFNEDFDTE